MESSIQITTETRVLGFWVLGWVLVFLQGFLGFGCRLNQIRLRAGYVLV